MKTLKLGFSKLPIPEKIQQSRTVVVRMTGNNNFAAPHPSLENVTAAANVLEAAYEAAQHGSREQRIFRDNCEAELVGLMKTLGAYVQSISMGDEHIIVGGGFGVRASRVPLVAAANPSHVRGQATIRAGEVTIRWNPAQGARIYVVEVSTDGTNWSSCGVATKVKMTITGLESGSKPAFRVAAIGASGQSGWSDPGYVRVD